MTSAEIRERRQALEAELEQCEPRAASLTDALRDTVEARRYELRKQLFLLTIACTHQGQVADEECPDCGTRNSGQGWGF